MRFMEERSGVFLRKVYRNNTSLAITLPKELVESEYYQISKEDGAIVLRPVGVRR
ncbi:MAG: hypothetical protein GXO00_00845 [Candidatus Diapherotrites archaeon]|nr:hypothetical protein [Candidatus Diapherotrites archaeon]